MIDGKEMLNGSYLKHYEIETHTIIKIMKKLEARGKQVKQGKHSEHPR
jgi:hypothetical protein